LHDTVRGDAPGLGRHRFGHLYHAFTVTSPDLGVESNIQSDCRDTTSELADRGSVSPGFNRPNLEHSVCSACSAQPVDHYSFIVLFQRRQFG
jgi:hypothetical protein